MDSMSVSDSFCYERSSFTNLLIVKGLNRLAKYFNDCFFKCLDVIHVSVLLSQCSFEQSKPMLHCNICLVNILTSVRCERNPNCRYNNAIHLRVQVSRRNPSPVCRLVIHTL